MKKSENYDLKNIGRRMRLIRARFGCTQTAMAKEIGISLSHYSKLEIGIGGMSRSLVYTICNTFGIRKEWFLNGIGPEPTNLKRVMTFDAPETQETPVTQELVSKIVALVLSKRMNKLAHVISKQTHIPLERALSILTFEQLEHGETKTGEEAAEGESESASDEVPNAVVTPQEDA